MDSVSYISVVIVVLANTTGLVIATLLPRYATNVLGVSTENVIFVAAPAAIGIWLAMRFVRERVGARLAVVERGRIVRGDGSSWSCCWRSSRPSAMRCKT